MKRFIGRWERHRDGLVDPAGAPGRRAHAHAHPFARAAAGLAAVLAAAGAVAASPGPHGALHRVPRGTATTSSGVMNVGDTYQDTITATCYDASGNPLADTVTLAVTGQPDTGGAQATFVPNPIQTFDAGATFTVTTTRRTDAGNYTMSVTGTGPVCGAYGPAIIPLELDPVLQLSRQDLVTVQATGRPVNGGTFSYQSSTLGGSTVAPIAMATGVTASTNPNTSVLSDPANPSGNGAPSQGGLGQYTVDYTVSGLKAVNDKADPFKVPVFGMSCYYTTLESDWGTAPDQCQSVRIHHTVYSGTVTDPDGYAGTYCSSFIAEVTLQGSGVTSDGTDIQYDPATGLITAVTEIDGADGTPVVAGQTVARSRTIIPGRGVHVDVHGVGTGLLANDTGNAIVGYRLDLYQGAGRSVCAGYANPMGVAACSPKQAKCPGSDLK